MSAVAGGAVLESFIENTGAMPYIAALAVIATILSSIHASFDCDRYQSECAKMIQAFGMLATRYRTVRDLPTDDRAERLRELDDQLAQIRASRISEPRKGYREKANAKLAN